MSPRTIFLSRLFGLSCILIPLPMMLHKQAVVEMATGLFRDPSMTFLVGVLTLVAGLATVLAHNIWSGGALPVVMTIVGWLTLIKGFTFLLLFFLKTQRGSTSGRFTTASFSTSTWQSVSRSASTSLTADSRQKPILGFLT